MSIIGKSFVLTLFGGCFITGAGLLGICTAPIVDGLKVAFTKKVTEDLCKYGNPTTLDKMWSECLKFCAINKNNVTLPILMGSETYGFDLSQMQSICLGDPQQVQSNVITNDQAKLEKCRQDKRAIDSMERDTVTFVRRLREFEIQQDVFRGEMNNQHKAFLAKIMHSDFTKEMDEARTSQKVSTFQYVVADYIRLTNADGTALEDLQSALNYLLQSGTKLASTVDTKVAQLKDYYTNCNAFLLGLGSANDFALDICSQNSVSCVDEVESAHVGCCCGVNPMGTPSTDFTIDGVYADYDWRVNAGRRLANNPPMDVCAEARKASDYAVEQAKEKLARAGQLEVYTSRQNELKSKYPEFFEHCSPSRRLSPATAPKAPEKKHVEAPGKKLVGEHSGEPLVNVSAGARRLGDLTTCSPQEAPSSGHSPLRVALSSAVNQQLCDGTGAFGLPRGKKIDETEMMAIATSFCSLEGAKRSPLLMGSSTFGFNLADANQICLKSSFLNTDHAKLQKCRGYSNGFQEIKRLTKDFVRQLVFVKGAEATVQKEIALNVDSLKKYLASARFVDKMARATDKAGTFRQEVRNKFNDKLKGTSGVGLLERESKKLSALADAFDKVLRLNILLLMNFTEECNDQFLATGAENEYLLDICSQYNEECFEHPMARHVSACCAYNPAVDFAQTQPQGYAIDGIKGAKDSRVNRRLSDSVALDDVCMAAWTDVVRDNRVSDFRTAGYDDVLLGLSSETKQRYGKDYCSPWEYAINNNIQYTPSPTTLPLTTPRPTSQPAAATPAPTREKTDEATPATTTPAQAPTKPTPAPPTPTPTQATDEASGANSQIADGSFRVLTLACVVPALVAWR